MYEIGAAAMQTVVATEVEEYWHAFGIRLGGGMLVQSVVLDDGMPQRHEGSYAPIGSVTFDLTRGVFYLIDVVFDRQR